MVLKSGGTSSGATTGQNRMGTPGRYGGTQTTRSPANLAPGTGSSRDQKIIASGDMGQISDRISAIFGNRGVGLAAPVGADSTAQVGNHGSYAGESAADRLARIAGQIASGDRTFDQVRSSVDRIAASPLQENPYRSELPPLPAEMLSMFGDQRRLAARGFADAQAQAEARRGRVDADRQLSLGQLLRRLEGQRAQGMDGFADVGMARNPRQAGRLNRDLRDSEVEGRGRLDADAAEQRAAIEAFLGQARMAKDESLLRLDRDMNAARAQQAAQLNPVWF